MSCALHEARQDHPEARPWLLTLTRDGAPAVAEGVTVQPAYQWMLAGPLADRSKTWDA